MSSVKTGEVSMPKFTPIIKKVIIYVSFLTSSYFSAMSKEDDTLNVYQSSKHPNELSPVFTAYDLDCLSIELLKNDFSIKFKAQRSWKEHLQIEQLKYGYSGDEIRKAIIENHDWMWNYIIKIAKRFFEAHEYESCMFQDVLLVGALHDIFENQKITNKNKQRDLLVVLEDACRYIEC